MNFFRKLVHKSAPEAIEPVPLTPKRVLPDRNDDIESILPKDAFRGQAPIDGDKIVDFQKAKQRTDAGVTRPSVQASESVNAARSEHPTDHIEAEFQSTTGGHVHVDFVLVDEPQDAPVQADQGAEDFPVVVTPAAEMTDLAPLRTIFDRRELSEDVLSYKHEIEGVVSASGAGKCQVLDLGFNTVAILSLAEFRQTGHYSTILHGIAQRGLIVAYEFTVTPELLKSFLDEAQKLRTKPKELSEGGPEGDQRNLRLFDEIIAGAYALEASDVHFVVGGTNADTSTVRLRIYGRMVDWKKIPTRSMKACLSAGYQKNTKTGTNSSPNWTSDSPCSTITEHDIRDPAGRHHTISGRFTSRPTVDGGAKVSIRLLETDIKAKRIPTFENLGYSPSQIELLRNALSINQGAIIYVGSTNSGKSTSLRTAMDQMPDKKLLELYSVEDPVEYIMPDVNQVSIQRSSDESPEQTKLKFLAALRDMMRMDPDAILIGEIRDQETAQLMTEFVLTGHRVLTTLHGNDPVSACDRLTGPTLNVDPVTLAGNSYLLLIVFQKLLPKLCECAVPAKPTLKPSQLEALKNFGIDPGTMRVAREGGCPLCALGDLPGNGTKGLTVVAEMIAPDRQILRYLRDRDWLGAYDYYRSTRRAGFGDPDMTGKTAFEHALYKMAHGMIDINDIERDFMPLSKYEIFDIKH